MSILLTNLTRKDQSFKWGKEEQDAFDKIKKRVLLEPVLMEVDPEKVYEIGTNALDFAIGGELG